MKEIILKLFLPHQKGQVGKKGNFFYSLQQLKQCFFKGNSRNASTNKVIVKGQLEYQSIESLKLSGI